MSGLINFDRLESDVKAHKEEAKLLRDDGDYQGAIEELSLAIRLIYESGWDEKTEVSDEGRRIAGHLADCLGMKGGNYRRLDLLDQALSCFREGKRLEEDRRFALQSSYNLVNAVVAPIEDGRCTVLDQQDEVKDTISVIEQQVSPAGNRRRDRWAWADLGECRLLVGDLPGAADAYREFIRLGDKDSIESALRVLRKLRDALVKAGDSAAQRIELGIQQLETGRV